LFVVGTTTSILLIGEVNKLFFFLILLYIFLNRCVYIMLPGVWINNFSKPLYVIIRTEIGLTDWILKRIDYLFKVENNKSIDEFNIF
jgi:hypothetical protein